MPVIAVSVGLYVYVPKAERHAHSLHRYCVYRLITVHKLASVNARPFPDG